MHILSTLMFGRSQVWVHVVAMTLFSSGLRADAPATQPATAPVTSATLHIGDPAPPIQVSAWFKGDPITQFEPGKIYVIEFWATWCGPCKATIPHLTELAKRYTGRASFAGISISEQPEEPTNAGIAALVRPFVDEMGKSMDYAVAADGVDRFMSTHWTDAAGLQTIPTAFVIDKTTHIAWMGHPEHLDAVLEKVVEGTWDSASAARDAAGVEAHKAYLHTLIAPVNAALAKRDHAGAISALNSAEFQAPELKSVPDVVGVHVFCLVSTSGNDAVSYIQSLAAPHGLLAANPALSGTVLRMLPLQQKSELLTAAQWKAIGEALKPALTANPHNFVAASGYADILHNAGDASAIDYKQSAITTATTQPSSPALKQWIAVQQRSLELMQTPVK